MKEPAQRLGRGLASLFGEVDDRAPPNAVGDIFIDRLEPNPFQPRGAIQPAELEDLTSSIAANGVLQPLLVRPHPAGSGRFQIVAGERRWRAAKAVGLETVPCLIRQLKDREAAAAALVENLQRHDLNAMEEAEGFRSLIRNFELTQDELASAVGKSRSHVANALRLLKLPETVAQQVRDGLLTAGHARAALACSDPVAAATRMVTEDLNVRQAEKLKLADHHGKERPKKPLTLHDPDRAAVEAHLGEFLGLRVKISFNGTGGTVKIQYKSLAQLDNIVERLGRPTLPN